MARIDKDTGAEYARIEQVASAPLGEGLAKQLTLTVGTSVYQVSPPSGDWQYLKVINAHATAVLYVAVNEDPVPAPAATPGVAADWEAGYPVGPLGSELVPLTGALTTIRLLSDTAGTAAVLALIA